MDRRPLVIVLACAAIVACPSTADLYTGNANTSDAGDGDAGGPGGTDAAQVEDARVDGCDGACAPDVLASGQKNPTAIAVYGDTVFWVNEVAPDGAVLACKVGGCGGNPTVLASNMPRPNGLFVFNGDVFFSTVEDGAVRDVLTDGGAANVRITAGALGVIVTSSYIYWPAADTLHFCKVSDCPGAHSLFVNKESSPSSLVRDETLAFWISSKFGGSVRSCDLGSQCDGNLAPNIVTNHPGAVALAVDQADVFWTNKQTSTLYRAAKTLVDGGVPAAFAEGQNNPSGIALDAATVYWTNRASSAGSDGSVMKKPKSGASQATALATGLHEPQGIAVNDTHVFWTNADGTVMRAPK